MERRHRSARVLAPDQRHHADYECNEDDERDKQQHPSVLSSANSNTHWGTRSSEGEVFVPRGAELLQPRVGKL